MRECFVELKRWHTNLLDVSINTSDSSAGTAHAVEEQLASDHEQVDQIESVESNTSVKESTVSAGAEEIWSPVRIARIVKKIRAIGRGRVEEVNYRLAYGFSKNGSKIQCDQEHSICNDKCFKTYIKNMNNDLMRMFQFRITEIERTTAQVEVLQFFDQAQPNMSTCVQRSSAIGSCTEVSGEEIECFECCIDGKINEILENFKMLKIAEETGFPTENIEWKIIGDEITEVLYKISDDKNNDKSINWLNLARTLRTFLIYLLNSELTAIQYQLITEDGFNSEEDMTVFLGGFEKGQLYQTLNVCKKIVLKRAKDDVTKAEGAILIKNRNKNMKIKLKDEEIFMLKENQFAAAVEIREHEVHGSIFTSELRAERFILIDPLVTKWTEKVKIEKMENMIGQLANLGVKVGRMMEVRCGSFGQEQMEGQETIESAFSPRFWEEFDENYDGTFGGDINATGAKYRAEPFHFVKLEDNRKLMPICLN